MDSTVELQRRIFAILTDEPAVTCNIYDHVPENAEYPYITFGSEVWGEDGADCMESFAITMQLDVWNDAPGRVDDVKPIMHAVIRALKPAITLTENICSRNEFVIARIVRDPDGVTTHGMIEFEFDLQE